MNRNFFAILAVLFLLNVSLSLAADVFVKTDEYVYSVNQSIYASVLVSENSTAVPNQSVVLTVRNAAGTSVDSKSLTTNSTGGANYTFSLTATGNYTILANASGTLVTHFIKVLPYSQILISLSKSSYTPGSTASLTATVVDSNNNGVAGVVILPSLRYKNGTLISTISSCTTGSAGTCTASFTVPSTEGEYIVEINNFENSVFLLVGGFDASMKISPSIAGRNSNVTIRVSVKNSNGNGVTASTRQLVIAAPNGTKTTITAMTQAVDSTGVSLTGVYEDIFVSGVEGVYGVVATVTPQGSNVTKELIGAFEIRAYFIEIGAWEGQMVFYPGSSASLGLKLKNATSGDNVASKATAIQSGTKIYDPSNVDTGISPSVTDRVSTDGRYKIDFTIPSTAASGAYKVSVSINDTFGSGSGTGYFTVQRAKGTVTTVDKFPDGVPTRSFVAGNQIVFRFSAQNASGTVPVTGLTSYTIVDRNGNDKTSLFGTAANYTYGNYTYLNLTAPKNGNDYSVRAKVSTSLGDISAEGVFFVKSLDISIRPVSVGGAGQGISGPTHGPGFFWFFRPNDTVQLNVSVTTASDSEGNEGFMTKGSFGGGPSNVKGGMFGIGGGSAVEGAQVVVTQIINTNTEEDWTSSITLTNCVTNSAGNCAVSMKSNVNSQNWTGGFYLAFINASTSDNKTDDEEGFFEVRRFFVDTFVQANTTATATEYGFQSFGSWNVGPTASINVNVTVREPGTWQTVSQNGTLAVLGVFYGGNAGEFIFPPKKIEGTTRLNVTITNGVGGVSIAAPTGGWKSGFYIVQVQVNISGQLDTGQGFMMSKVFEGFGQPVNPQNPTMPDFTVGTNENVSLKVSVFDVVNFRPAANLTVSFDKILSFAEFPPGQLSYDKSVSQGTTGSDGSALMTLEPPTGGWTTGSYLAVFTVSNSTHSDHVEGFFMVRNFFVELSASQWRFGRRDTVTFNVSIASDPSWMRQQFGGGCPAGDPGCGGQGGPGGQGPPPSGGGGGGPVTPIQNVDVSFVMGQDLDNDMAADINITVVNLTTFAVNLSALGNASIAYMGCINSTWSDCPAAEKNLEEFNPWSFRCFGTSFSPRQTYINRTNMTLSGANLGSYNATGARFYCVNSTLGRYYKVGMMGPKDFQNPQNWTIEYIQDSGDTSSVGGSSGVSFNPSQGFSYYNATLKGVKVVRHNFATGAQALLSEITDYNVTSADGTIKGGSGKIPIPGVGSFKLVPTTSSGWSTGDYQVIATFNTSSASEEGVWGFNVETFFTSCSRSDWRALESGSQVNVTCTAVNPSSGSPYTGSVEWNVESVSSTMTGASVSSSSWAAAKAYGASVNILLNQSLSNGYYQALIRANESSDTKTNYIWFDVRDFDAYSWTQKWSYGSSENVIINAEGWSNNVRQRINLANTSGNYDITAYKYDRNTWTASAVGVNVSTQVSNDRALINLSRSGGFDEGSYQVVMNLTKVTAGNVATGGKVQAYSWFEVRLFDVWAWSDRWSNHPMNNVTLKVFVGAPGGGGYYNGNVNVEVVKVENTQTGATLTNGTDYRTLALVANPSNAGNIDANITPLGSGLPTGQYRAKIRVTPVGSSASAFAEGWFEVVSFYLNSWTERWEYAAGENVTVILSAYSPNGVTVNLSDARITQMGSCGSSSCSSIDASAVNYTFNRETSRISLNTTGLSQGQYWMQIRANDTQNASASSGTGFRIAAFAVSSKILKPYEFTNDTYRWDYYINETMKLNVTGTIGVNVTNATFTYWLCDYNCVYNSFVINIGRVMSSTTETINLTPPGLNSTWYTSQWGWVWYNVDVRATSGGSESMSSTSAGVGFPWVWRVNGTSDVSPTQTITSELNVTLDYDGRMPVASANVSLRRIRSYNTWGEINSSTTNWTSTTTLTNSLGAGYVAVTPSGSFVWPNGDIWLEFEIKYGNATTAGGRKVSVSQKNLRIEGKTIYNATNSSVVYVSGSQKLATLKGNNTFSEKFNITIVVSNPSGSAVTTNATITLPKHSTTANATAINYTNTPLTYPNVAINATGLTNFTWQFNVTLAGNWSGSITLVPASATMSSTTTTYSFESV